MARYRDSLLDREGFSSMSRLVLLEVWCMCLAMTVLKGFFLVMGEVSVVGLLLSLPGNTAGHGACRPCGPPALLPAGC